MSAETKPRTGVVRAVPAWYDAVRSYIPQIPLGLALLWLLAVVVLALFADLLPLADPNDADFGNLRRRPGWRTDDILGTDLAGRSMLSRIIYGSRMSLYVGVLSPLIGLVVGGILGLAAGYYRGWVDRVLSLVFDSWLAFPPLVLLIAVVATFGADRWKIVVALSAVVVPTFGRLTRANTMTFAEREFVRASQGMGAQDARILFREITPNVIFPLISYTFILSAVLVVAEGTLSFIGVGVQPPTPTWGNMINQAREELKDHPHLVFIPAVVFFLTVFSLNTLGDALRRRFDVREANI